MYREGTFPSGKIFPSQKGQPLNFSKPLIIFLIFLLSHDERKLGGGGEKKNSTLEERSSWLLILGNARLMGGHYPTYFKNAQLPGHY